MVQKDDTSKVFKFSSLSHAMSFTERCEKLYVIVLGDDGKFWVTTLGEAQELETLGYEIVNGDLEPCF